MLPLAYLDLQLRFAEAVAQHGDRDLAMAVGNCTNLIRRFGLGPPDRAVDEAPWREFVETLVTFDDHRERLAWADRFARRQPTNLAESAVGLSAGLTAGPFSVEIVGPVARTHFVPIERGDRSPLARSERPRRRAELHLLFRELLTAHPEVRSISGASWLYGIDAYRSLFPDDHIATATERVGRTRFQGSSSWGQFLDHRGQVKKNLYREFLQWLDHFDPETPWTVFPVPTLVVCSPIEVFSAFYAKDPD